MMYDVCDDVYGGWKADTVAGNGYGHEYSIGSYTMQTNSPLSLTVGGKLFVYNLTH